MTFYSPKDGHQRVRPNVPQAESVICGDHPHGVKTAVGTIPTAPALKPGGSKVTFADRQQQVRIPGVKLQLIDGIPMADVVLQPETSLGYSGRTHRGAFQALYLDALHGDVVDDADDAARAGHGQQGVAGVGVVRPCARVEVLICLSAWGQGKNDITSGFELNTGDERNTSATNGTKHSSVLSFEHLLR